MNYRVGFTVVELIITMAIVAILLTLGVASLRNTEITGRDEKRKGDISNTALFLENIYSNGTHDNPEYKGAYPPVAAVSTPGATEAWFRGFDVKSLRAPGVDSPTFSIIPATNNAQSAAGVSPQPTISTYVYQPIDGDGTLCATLNECRKFNLYYLPEASGSSIIQVTSRNQ